MAGWSLQRKILTFISCMVFMMASGIAIGKYIITKVQIGSPWYQAIVLTTTQIDGLARLRMNLNMINGQLYTMLWEYDDETADSVKSLLDRSGALLADINADFKPPDKEHPLTCITCHGLEPLSDLVEANEASNAELTRLRATVVEQILPLLAEEDKEGAVEMLQGEYEEQYTAVLEATKGEIETCRDSLESLQRMSMTFTDRMTALYSLGGAGNIILIFAISLFFVRRLNRTVKTIANELEGSAGTFAGKSEESAATSHSLAEMSSQLSASLEETASSLEEISSMVQQNDTNAHEARQAMHENDGIVAKANDQMQELQASMEKIQADSGKIANIIKEIESIAFQTNLLALNAAVESARAGAHGQGFAVVADEVRNLAQRTASSAQNSSALLSVSLENVKEGLNKVLQVADGLTAITESSRKIGVLVDDIATASHEQSQGVLHIRNAVSEMDSETQELAANSDQQATTAQQLLQQTDALRVDVVRLLALVEGERQGG